MLTSDHIDMLLTVIDKGSFSAAARALGRTPSAVSMAIANLEAELDLVLFDRGTRGRRERAFVDDGQQHVDVIAGQHGRPSPVRKIERT